MLYSQLDEKNENLKFMGKKIDLLINYPKPKRNLDKRASEKSKDDISIARKFGKEFFDGDRKHGYGEFKYDPKFWQPVIPTFKKYWNLTSENSILDVGCYPVSFSSLIANLDQSNLDNPEIVDVSGSICETGVDEIAYSTLIFKKKFTAKIGAAIRLNMKNQTLIIGSKGNILIKESICNPVNSPGSQT